MARYQFSVDVKEYIEMLRPHLKKSSLEDKRRKLRLISKIFTGLYEEGVVSSNNPRKITKEDIIAYVGLRRSKGISESTIGKDICLLNQFFLWLDNH